MHNRSTIVIAGLALWALVATVVAAFVVGFVQTQGGVRTETVTVRREGGVRVQHAATGIEAACPSGTARVRTDASGFTCQTEEQYWIAAVRAEPTDVPDAAAWIVAENAVRDPRLPIHVLGELTIGGIAGVRTAVQDEYEAPLAADPREQTFYGVRDGMLYQLSFRAGKEGNDAFLESFQVDNAH